MQVMIERARSMVVIPSRFSTRMESNLPSVDMDGEAEFSPDRVYRYVLRRSWSPLLAGSDAGHLTFIMLNPSTADAAVLDPTVRRCVTRAMALGFSRMEVVNLFALRSTDPRALRKHPDPVGPGNQEAIYRSCRGAAKIIAAWGANGEMECPDGSRRDRVVVEMLREFEDRVFALGFTFGGQPRHPLYMANSCPELRFPFLGQREDGKMGRCPDGVRAGDEGHG